MIRALTVVFLLLVVGMHPVKAQAIAGWESLPDSLAKALNLDVDQLRRIRVIEEDYKAEQQEVWSTPGEGEEAKRARLVQLGQARSAEIEGVMGHAKFERWRQLVAPDKP